MIDVIIIVALAIDGVTFGAAVIAVVIDEVGNYRFRRATAERRALREASQRRYIASESAYR